MDGRHSKNETQIYLSDGKKFQNPNPKIPVWEMSTPGLELPPLAAIIFWNEFELITSLIWRHIK